MKEVSNSVLSAAKKRAARFLAALKDLIPRAGIVLRYRNNWELLVAVILSAQCTDKKVNEVTPALFAKYPTLGDYVRASASKQTVQEFERDVRPTGFYRSKTRSILGAAKAVQERFGGKLPRTMAEMLTIPGVGRKTANVVLGNAYGVVEGISVDTHVRRLARAFGFSKESNPEKIERDLMRLFPKREWFDLTYRLIEYGRRYCPARKHDHGRCPLQRFET
ncbi:endonuclease III [Candidatus Jorgensenbacteria bacterium CG10_big_fil_rev_8_21_14_0_10_54_38]|uniref:Endonuclease III n=1 Tax=Candidatus Jorgensenbacteria bacterium CG10_big_fil_rev_8_21_14_0_10_54_38 TaxID=1974593 RepID=A0A2M6WGA5_9BACT|nr:MAG: endonuclease III [Candidatus Jorgensenbacteria bacterium CG10_big_fil_rev_8_21_14_0_10_54_38]